MCRAVAVGLILLALGFSGPAGTVRAADPAAKSPEGAEFDGKFVAINYRMGIQHNSGLFKGLSLKKLAGRAFLVGEVAYFHKIEEEQDWRGVEIWIPTDEVESMMIFKDFAQATRVARKGRQSREAAETFHQSHDLGPDSAPAPPVSPAERPR